MDQLFPFLYRPAAGSSTFENVIKIGAVALLNAPLLAAYVAVALLVGEAVL